MNPAVVEKEIIFRKSPAFMAFLRSKIKSGKGASYVEAAISLLIFIPVVFGIIDLCRFFYTYAILNYAAYSALRLASTLEVETDTRASSCAGVRAYVCTDYLNRVTQITDEAGRLAALVAQPSTAANAFVRLVALKHYDSDEYPTSGLGSGVWHDVGFMRPGEILVRADGSTLEHASRSPGTNAGQGWPKTGESWASIFAVHPLEMVIEFDFQTITPLLPTMRARVHHMNFRITSGTGVPLPGI